MLDHLRQHVIDILKPAQVVTLSTCAQARIQAQGLPREARGLGQLILVELHTEHLFNLEQAPAVVITTAEWQLRGEARQLAPADAPTDLDLLHSPQAAHSAVVEVCGRQLQVGQANGWGFQETIDIVEEPAPG